MADAEHVTVLFTDMVGSTALAAGMSPAEADDLRRTHFSLLRQAIAAAGATEVKNLGDGLMVVSSLASAGLECAVSMQQAIDVHNRTTSAPVGLRVGVSCGEVTREGDDYFGDAVVEAARLCARPVPVRCSSPRWRGRQPDAAAPTPSSPWDRSSSKGCPSHSRFSTWPGCPSRSAWVRGGAPSDSAGSSSRCRRGGSRNRTGAARLRGQEGGRWRG